MAICSYPLAKVLMEIGRPQERSPPGWKWEASLSEEARESCVLGVCVQSAQSSGGVTWVSGTPAAVLGIVTGITAMHCLYIQVDSCRPVPKAGVGRLTLGAPGSQLY